MRRMHCDMNIEAADTAIHLSVWLSAVMMPDIDGYVWLSTSPRWHVGEYTVLSFGCRYEYLCDGSLCE